VKRSIRKRFVGEDSWEERSIGGRPLEKGHEGLWVTSHGKISMACHLEKVTRKDPQEGEILWEEGLPTKENPREEGLTIHWRKVHT
jgi:hypothetical protein